MLLLLLLLAGRAAAAPEVVVSIAPLHSLVAGVMAGVGEPRLLIPGSASPHAYALRPSDRLALDRAGLVVWVGEGLERFLERPLAALRPGVRTLAMEGLPGVVRLPNRGGSGWEEGHDEHGDGLHDEHRHGAFDPHLWLSPANAAVLSGAVAEALAGLDAGNAARYRANAEAQRQRLAALDEEVQAVLAPVRGFPFLVFHDAYQYFEAHYGLTAVGAVTFSPEGGTGARHLLEVRRRLAESGARCLFREPQFDSPLVTAATRGMAVRVGVLDPLGSGLPTGPGGYEALLRGLAAGMRECLAGEER